MIFILIIIIAVKQSERKFKKLCNVDNRVTVQ